MNYQHTITAPVSASAAFRAINQVSGWWARHVEGPAESLHDMFTVRFGTTWVTFEVTEMTPYHGLVPEAECYEQCERGWNEHFGESLTRFLTEQVGMPA